MPLTVALLFTALLILQFRNSTKPVLKIAFNLQELIIDSN